MITLEARIEVNGVPDVKIKEAVSNIPDTVGNYNIFAGMVVTAGTFIGSQYSNSEGNFVERYDAAEKTMWFEAQRMTFSPSGRVIYNDIPCFYFEVAYETNLSDIIRYVSYANVNQLIVTPVEGTFCEAETNFNIEESIGTLVRLYIPVELAESSGKEAFEFMPKVRMNVTFGRESGEKGKAYEITIITDNPTENLSVSFGIGTNEYPHSVIVDGTERTVKSKDFSISGLMYSTRHTVVVENWRKAYSPLYISNLATKKTDKIVIDKRNILSLDSSIMSVSDVQKPSFGIMSNSGSITFADRSGNILFYANNGLLSGGLKASIAIKNTIQNFTYEVGTYYTTDWNYDNQNKTVTVSFGDDLQEWQDINVAEIIYDPRNPTKVFSNLGDLYSWMCSKTPSKYNMIYFDELDAKTKSILSSTTIEYPFLKQGNLWEQWTKICQVCALCIYKNRNDKTICSYMLGN